MKKLFQSLLIDSNPIDVEILQDHLTLSKLFAPPFVTDNVMSAYQLLFEQPIDLIFMDVDLNGAPGLDLLALLPNHPPVIVISAHTQYAVDCFDLDIADFIQKPFTFTRLCRAISRALPTAVSVSPATSATQLAPISRDSIYLKVGRKTERFNLDDIQYVEAYGIYIKVHTRHALVVANEKISRIEKLLPDNQFIRIHKSCIINLAGITRIEPKAISIGKAHLNIGVTFQDKVHHLLRELAIER